MGASKSVSVMTVKKGVLTYEPLEREAFFGRDKELAYLENAVSQNKHVLVSGVGGIGKTELLRQVIRSVIEKNTVDELWLVSWNGNIKDSFLAAVKGDICSGIEDKFAGLISEFRLNTETRRLIVIDNLDEEVTNDPLFEILASLSNAVLISSRMSSAPGYEVLALNALPASEGAKIFEHAYGHKLSTSEFKVVKESIESVFMRHTLSIGLIGRYMRRQHEPISNLGSIGSEIHAYTLPQIYRGMYHVFGMSDEERTLLAFLARCPRESYPLSFLIEYYPRGGRSIKAFLKTVGDLADGGWLTLNNDEVSVQPYIAENIIKLTKCPKEVEEFVVKAFRSIIKEKPEDSRVIEYVEELALITGEKNRVLYDMIRTFCEKYMEVLPKECFMAYVLTQGASWNYEFNITKLVQEYVYLKAESVGTFTEIMFRLRCQIKTETQMAEIDRMIRSVENELTIKTRCIIYYLFVELGLENYAYEYIPYYAEYILKHTDKMDYRVAANMAMLTYYIIKENLQACEQIINEMLKLDISDDEITLNMMTSMTNYYNLIGQYQEAYRCVKKAEEASDRMNGINRVAINMLMATVLMNLGRYEEADTYFSASLEYLDSTMEVQDITAVIHAKQQYAILMERLGRFEEAEKMYKFAINSYNGAVDPGQINIAKNNLAVLYIRMGRGEEALEILDALLKIAPADAQVFGMEVLNNHSKACELVGDKERALKETQESYPLLCNIYGPEHRKSIEAKERLERLSN